MGCISGADRHTGLAGAAGLMGMCASCLPLLWLRPVCAIAISGPRPDEAPEKTAAPA
jgi:hypothetical protein